MTASKVAGNTKDGRVEWQEYFQDKLGGERSLCNVPVASSISRVHFVAVPHPGVYGVRVVLAQTKKGAELFYKRVGQQLPEDWEEHIPVWDDTVIVSTLGGKPTNGESAAPG